MNESRLCPECGAEVPADAPAGQCPKCLLQAGFASEDVSHPQPDETAPSPTSARFEAPPVASVARLFPQLEVLELIGQGGMGAVYKARQPGLDRLVAVKILPPEVGRDPAFAERFTREARALARLSHPNIVAVHDFGQTETISASGGRQPPDSTRRANNQGTDAPRSPSNDGLFYFVMEYIDGANLRQAMQAGGLKADEALAIVPQICDALQYAHDEGVVHRDIKPENILLDRKGRVKIADFGLSKLLASGGRESPDISLTGTHQVMGTLRYMAPEQMQGTKSVDHRADIYSLGVVFYELLTGDVPMGRFDPPSQRVEIDVRLDEVVLRALAQEPDKRYQRASEVKTDVESIGTEASFVRRRQIPAADDASPPSANAARQSATVGRSKVRGPAELLIAASIMTLLTGIGIVAWWFATGEFDRARSYASEKGRLQWNMMAIAGVHGLYALLVGSAAFAMRALRARLYSLLVVIMVGLLMPAMFIVNCLGTYVPEWPALIPFWIALPVALWAVAVLLRQDVCEMYDKTALDRQNNSGKPAADVGDTLDPPTWWLSQPAEVRKQLRGSLWLAFLALAIIFVSFGWREQRTGGPDSPETNVRVFEIGAFDPWYQRETYQGPNDGSSNVVFRGSSGIDLISWSMLAGVLAAVLLSVLVGVEKLERSARTESGQPSGTDSATWRGTPLTQIRFVVNDDCDFFSQAIFHFSAFGYELVEQRADACIFERGRKGAGLWTTNIRNYRTRLTVRTASAPDGRVWVSCEWSVRTEGSWITRRDIRKLEAEGRELEAMLVKGKPADQELVTRGTDELTSRPNHARPHRREESTSTVRSNDRPSQNLQWSTVLAMIACVLGVISVCGKWAFAKVVYESGQGSFLQLSGVTVWQGVAAAVTFGALGLLLLVVVGLRSSSWLTGAAILMGGIATLASSLFGWQALEKAAHAAAVLGRGNPLEVASNAQHKLEMIDQTWKLSVGVSIALLLLGAINLRAALKSHDPSSAWPQQDFGHVSAVIAVLLLLAGIVVPLILLAFVNDGFYHPAVWLAFFACQVLAAIFGLLGRRFRLGKFTAAGAVMLSTVVFLGQLLSSYDAEPSQQRSQGWGVADPATKGEGEPTSKPTEVDGRKALEQVFAASGVPVKVVRFSRTEWKDYDKFVPPQHDMAYEAEIEFQKECQMKEQQAVHWSPWQNPDLDRGYTIIVGETVGETDVDPVRFKKGEQKTIRGCLVFRWKSGSWRQVSTIQVAR